MDAKPARAWSCGQRVAAVALGLSTLGAWPAAAQDPSGPALVQAVEKTLVDAIARAEPSVVAIARVRKDARTDQLPTDADFVPQEFGTGVVIDRNGLILTNYHVLGDPALHDYYVWVQRRPFKVARVEVPEKIVAGDPWTDLAVLKIAADNLQPITFGDASQLKKGMLVVALGNPYAIARDGQASASWGIVSNLGRAAPPNPQPQRSGQERDTLHHYGTLIQTDCRLALGTSGGALLNLRGEMIGLTTSLAAMRGYDEAAGFAVPVDETFRRTVETLKSGRTPDFGFLGVQPEELPVSERQHGRFGARIVRVVPGSPAARAGLRDNDVVTHVGGRPVYDRLSLFRELASEPAEARVELTVQRLDPARVARRTLAVPVVLAKKYIDSPRQPFALEPPLAWRGIQVEFPSALPPDLTRPFAGLVDPEGSVAVLTVARGSPAWDAGLRPGDLISHVENTHVATPREFFQAIQGRSEAVRLHLIVPRGENGVRIVTPPPAPAAATRSPGR